MSDSIAEKVPVPGVQTARGPGVDDDRFLSFAQERLLFLDSVVPGCVALNVPLVLSLRGRLDLVALKRTLGEIIRRHEVLRTSFPSEDGSCRPRIDEDLEVDVPLVEVGGTGEDQENLARRLALEEARRPFDLVLGPVFRARLLRRGEEAHWLVLTIHNVAFDAWSRRILLEELSALYEAFAADRVCSLPDPPVQYADYVAWQNAQLQGDCLEGLLAYWRVRFAGAPPVLELPTDRPRPASQHHDGARRSATFSAELIECLRSLGHSENASLFMTLLAAFKVLLFRYTGQEDLVVGTLVAGRNHVEAEALIGLFVNELPLRTDLSGAPSFRELLQRVRQTTLGAFAHQDLPFEVLVSELNPERSLAHPPIFQVVFQLQSNPRGIVHTGGLEIDETELDIGVAQFDLAFDLIECDDGLVCRVDYDTSLFEAATIDRMLGHYRRLLEGIAADPEQPISRLPVLTEAERHQLLVEWNDTARDYPSERCIHELFEEQVERTPDAVALVFEDRALTYRELNIRSNRLAHRLALLGVCSGSRVALCVDRSLELVIGLLGILKAGAAYVPLDPSYPKERLAFMIQDTAAAALLTQRSLGGNVAAEGKRVLFLDEDCATDDPQNDLDPSVGVAPDDLAYVMYTSGSTGLPKGVEVLHRGVIRLLFGNDYVQLDASRTILQMAPISFDASTFEIWGALLHGGRCVLFPERVPSLARLDQVLREQRVNTLWLTSALFNTVIDESPESLAGVTQLLAGGDVLSVPHVRRALAHLPETQLINGYGPTETTTFACCYRISRMLKEGASSIPIGRPINATTVYVLNEVLEPVPVGAAGELYIGGAGVARGYLNRPDLSAEKFVSNPFSGRPGDRLYKTGDLVRWRSDGNLEFLGRLDHQVKIRGFRIELGEIEARLAGHPNLAKSVVVAWEDEPGEKRLVAYVVPADPASPPSTAELRSFLGEVLPDYMIPPAFVVLDRLPLNPNGKVDRKALPAPTFGTGVGEGHVAPRTVTEELLAAIWADLLKLERVGARDNFFDLGGHSLLATQVVSRVRQEFEVELPLRSLFDTPIIAGLAKQIENLQCTSQRQIPPIQPVPRTGPLLLSFAQQRLWFLDQYETERAIYNISYALRLLGSLDVDLLRSSLTRIVHRHEALRTIFTLDQGQPVQVIVPAVEVDLPIVDLSELPKEEREREAQVVAAAEARHAFDLSSGLLMRAQLIRISNHVHVLQLNVHHIVFDGWSMGLLLEELKEHYHSLLTGYEPRVADLPVQYADYAAWQRKWLQGEELERQLDYWKERLAEAPALLELPTDRPRPALQSYRGACEFVEFSPTLSDSLKVLSRQEGVTLFMTLLAGFNVLLSRYSGQEDVVVGSVIAGRTQRELEHLIGFFVNTLVYRTDLSGNPTVRELLGRVREVAMGAYAHQDLPFEKLVEELRPPRSLSYSPLIQVLLVLQNAPQADMEMAGLEVSQEAVHTGTSKFDMTLSVEETSNGLLGTLEYNTDLFEAATIRRMLGHYNRLLEGMVAEPGQSINRLPMLSEAERHQLLVEWNDTAREYPTDRCIHQLFEEQVERTPDAVAVVLEDRALTYHELNARSNQLAHQLRTLGVAPETLVAICMERSLELVVGLLGILKAGGAYVPLDPKYPADRLRFMLEDSQAAVVVTQESLTSSLPVAGAGLVCLNRDSKWSGDEPADNPQTAVMARNAAYMIYTSGSTGKPKGVVIEHRNAAAFITWSHAVFSPLDLAGVLCSTSICFDLSVFEIFVPLSCGGKVIIVPNALSLPTLTAESPVTLVNTVPSAIAKLLELGHFPDSVTTVNLAGEPLEQRLVQQIYRQTHTRQVFDLYGPSESTTYSTYVLREMDGPQTIGRPISNTQAYVLNNDLDLVPVGVAGELYIGGAGVARGYLNRPDLTAEKFVSNPFSGRPGDRLYKTGDLVRWRSDGNLEFLGRLDHQVKIRGFRIELGEIEARLAGHPALAQSVVVAWEDEPGEKRLVAYVVPADPASPPSTAELRSFLGEVLPDYMIPSAFVVLDRLPLNPNGKIDRKALPAPTFGTGVGEGHVAPRTVTEELLAAIWADLLKHERVGAHDNFFELGGHSLLATRVVARVRQTFGVELPLRGLFDSPTIAGLAVHIEHLRATSSSPSPPILPVSREGPLPLSFAQQRLWFLDQYETERAVYNVPFTLCLHGPLDVGQLRASLTRIVSRHEALRTTIALVEGQPVQAIAPAVEVELPLVDLSDLPEGQRDQQARAFAVVEARRPFDLSTGPLVRAQLIRLSTDEHRLLLSLHHIVSDGWSMGVLLEELQEHYRSLIAGDEPRVTDLPVQYADYAAWQRKWLQGEELERQLDYWKERLAGAPALLELPTDRPRPALQSYRGACEFVEFSPTLSDSLKVLSRQEGVTLFMTLLAGFNVLLSRYSGQEDVVVGSVIAGRTQRELEHLIGFFVNTLVYRTDLSGNPTVRELLGRVREVAMGAYAHQDLPFEKLVEELKPPRSPSYSPLIQVLMVLQNAPQTSTKVAGLDVQEEAVHTGTSKFDMTLSVEETSNGLLGTLEYNTDLFEAATIRRMLGHYNRLLEGMVGEPEQSINRLPMLSEAERHQLLVEWNDTARDYPSERCIHELFEEQVERTPDAVAVVFEDRALTYRELNIRSNRLAHRLALLGVCPRSRVALCVDRSLELVIGVLGILKAGAAYVPLDPSYPKERLAFMIQDTAAAALLTQRSLRGNLTAEGKRVLLLDEDCAADDPQNDLDPAVGVAPDDLAYVMYTSGSTGLPKGVEVLHRGVIRLLFGNDYVQLDASRTILQMAPISFDASTFEIWGALLHGGRCVLFPERGPSLARLDQVLREQRVNTLWLTSALFNTVIDESPESLAGVTQLLAGGDVLSVPHVRRALAHLPETQLINGYGPTETTTFACCYRISRMLKEGASSIPIGRPINATTVYVLNEVLEPVPVGAAGELYIGGAGVARGYLNRPDLSAEKFVSNPFSGRPGDRLYKTGDLVRWRSDGNLEFLGRLDHQVKIRGFRIEPGEIEARLAGHPALAQSVVAVREDEPGEKRLVAYVVPADPASPPSTAELRSFLGEVLPDYMIPSAFVVLDRLPLSPNGKIDRKALPAPTFGTRVGEGHVAPRTVTEELLATIWANLLKLERVGVHDNFFDRGGHSLLATVLFRRIETEFQTSIPLGSVFIAQTIAEQADLLVRAQATEQGKKALPIQARQSRRPQLFLVHGMEGDLGHWRYLVHHLGADIDAYGLVLPEMDGVTQCFSTLEAMAAYHVEKICALQPEGPYHLAGYSYGARVSLEIANQLLSSGRRIGVLAVIDSGPFTEVNYWADFSMKRFTINLYNWMRDIPLKMGPSVLLEQVWLKIRRFARRAGIIPNPLPASSPINSLEGFYNLAKLSDGMRDLVENNYLIWCRYEPKPYAGRVTLFRARTRPLSHSLSADLGWNQIAQEGVDIHTIKSGHWRMMIEPHVKQVALELRKCLMSDSEAPEFPGEMRPAPIQRMDQELQLLHENGASNAIRLS